MKHSIKHIMSIIGGIGAATLLVASGSASAQVIAISRELTVYGEPVDVVATAGVTSIGRELTVQGYPCYADQDDGGPTGGRSDGGVTIEDLLYFLRCFEAGTLCADLDDDGNPAVGNPDGGVTIDDLLFFLARFEAGC
jgi:hypothetical protein